jgi:hypothetical protein
MPFVIDGQLSTKSSTYPDVIFPPIHAKAPMLLPVDTMTEAFTVSVSDIGRMKRVNVSSEVIVTLPANLSVGSSVSLTQAGIGQIAVQAGAGASLRQREGFTKTAGQNAALTAVVVENVGGTAAAWLLSGDMGS